MQENMYDCIVIGGGPAALTAAIYLGRYERNTLVLANSIGGQTALAGTIENYPGYDSIEGFDLINKMKEQAEKTPKVKIEIGAPVESIEATRAGFSVKNTVGEFEAKTVIIAAGKHHRELGLDNERELTGRGVSYCATCDGPLSKGKTVAVVGNGNSAVSSAILLSKLAEKVYIINRDSKFLAETARVNKIKEDKKVEILENSEVIKIIGENGVLSSVETKNFISSENKILKIQFLFIDIGWVPNTAEFLSLIKTNEQKEIVINPKDNSTSVKGIYAAGDITDVPAKQIVIACGEGAKAAIAINKILG